MRQGRRHERAVKMMLDGWKLYAEAHRSQCEAPIGEDYVTGDAWRDIGKGIRALLNSETGDLDCTKVDTDIQNTFENNGFERDGED